MINMWYHGLQCNFGINYTRNAFRKANCTRLRLVQFITFLNALLVQFIQIDGITYTKNISSWSCTFPYTLWQLVMFMATSLRSLQPTKRGRLRNSLSHFKTTNVCLNFCQPAARRSARPAGLKIAAILILRVCLFLDLCVRTFHIFNAYLTVQR